MLTRAKSAFRTIETPLAGPPILRHLRHWVDTRVFLRVLAYHVPFAVETALLNQGETRELRRQVRMLGQG